jgi:hypothetical protein
MSSLIQTFRWKVTVQQMPALLAKLEIPFPVRGNVPALAQQIFRFLLAQGADFKSAHSPPLLLSVLADVS